MSSGIDQSLCRFRWTYPLVDLQTGEVKTCCHTVGTRVSAEDLKASGTDVFLNGSHQLERRREMLEGIRHPSCVYCWKMEDNGVTSPRQGPSHFKDYLNRAGQPADLARFVERGLADRDALKSRHPLLLEILLGNSCNLKCLYCSDHFSSAWESEMRRYDELPPGEVDGGAPEGFEDVFWRWLEEVHSSLEYISFIGGEPLLIPRFYEQLERIWKIYLRSGGTARPMIGIISNFSVSDSSFARFLELLPRLSESFEVLLLASVDTTGARAEYIRHGLSWERFEKNVRSVMSLRLKNVHFCINPSINAMSVTTMLSLLSLAKSLQDEYQYPVALGRNMIVTPDWCSPLILPSDHARFLDECADFVERNIDPRFPIGFHGDWKLFVDFVRGIATAVRRGQPDPVARAQFLRRVSDLDLRRGTRFASVFPELREFWNEIRGAVP
ncbi:MAG: twitch domain-containing radical SAM protein [Oligoflexia bacterium]|nr:twitch domain-containing radical SAM protein [Oligoflexia bacterium]